ncbi:hypothetical protein [Homoserinibacter sp. GY 40078]|uniref:hypothetical protein n=1 Tax=Homoserinibacter sp. GY 40078 TaxID=2603275 RepID=UPI0011C9AD37|nr:hypothetical protein [Homoserinibacter sp. GY 40078]TXK17511.1 hypothetical protein FVQ89_11860 [Homoserinibacter sp. GY 40078]
MPALVVVSYLACLAMAVGVVLMLRSRLTVARVTRLLLATVVGAAVSTGAAAMTGAESPVFLLGAAAAVLPIALLLDAACEEAAPGEQRVAWVLIALWAAVIFPTSAIVPLKLFAMCPAPECRIEDFGGALPLLVSSAASVLLAWRVRFAEPAEQGARFLGGVLTLWLSTACWLASLEAAIDPYTPRILLAAIVSPVGGAAAWLLVDLLRQSGRHPLRSAADGVIAGLVAIIPGAATISFPWSLAVGALAGGAAALVYGSRRTASGGRAAHAALVVLTSTAIGYLAPAVSGDTIGLVFSGRIAAVVPPVAAFAAVTAFGIVASVPAWMLRRRTTVATDDETPG